MATKGGSRYTRMLDQFTEDKPAWTVADLASQLDIASSTLYKWVRELVALGFLEATLDAQYRLGPAFLEFERRLRRTDPLLRAGDVFLADLVEKAGFECTAILARLYGNKVMCVADAHSAGMQLTSSFERGLPMPLTKSATSRAILSVIESRRLKRFLQRETELTGQSLSRFLEDVFTTRKQGYWISHGEVDPGAMGIAVPLFDRQLGLEASLSLVVRTDDVTEEELGGVIALLAQTVESIRSFLAAWHKAPEAG
ncbi:IclR family transcriptional regulator [Rhizobium sp. PAMB 3182]